jgi:hypothetical protein
MSTTAITTAAPTALPRRTLLTSGPVWLVGAVTGTAAATVLYGYGAAASALSIPMRAAAIGSSTMTTITPGAIASGVLFWSLVGTALALLVNRWAARPAHAFRRATVALTLISLAAPLGAPHVVAPTRVALVFAHLLAAAIVIPVLTRRLAHTPRPTAVDRRA